MDLLNEIRHGAPATLQGDFAPHREVDAGNKEIPTALHEPREIAQASFRRVRMHMAQEPVRHDDILNDPNLLAGLGLQRPQGAK